MTKLVLVLEDFTSKLNNLKSKSGYLISKIDPEFSKECNECKELIEEVGASFEQITIEINAKELQRKMESETLKIREFYKSILDGIVNGVWVANKDDKIFYANKGMEAIAGISADLIVGARVLKDFPESTLKYFKPYYQEAKGSLKTVYYEAVPVVTPAGRQSYQSGWLIPLIKDGNYDGIICTVEDVTERKNYEEQLRESKKQLAKLNKELELKVEEKTKALKVSEKRYKDERDNLLNILNSMEDGVYIINQQYEIEYVNPSLKKNFGPIDNKKCYEYFQNNSVPCSFCKSLEKTENKTNRWEWDSSITQKIYELIVTPLKNLDGSDSRLVIFHDITDRKKAEMSLKRSENSYKTLTENLPCLVYRVNVKENNRMDFFNDLLQPMTGYSVGELTHGEVCSIDPFIYPGDKENVVKNVKKAVGENRPFEVEYRLMHKNGCIKWLNERGRPVIGDDGELHSIDGVIFDITDRKKAEERILYQAKLVESVSDAIISSDLDFNIISWNKAAEATYGWNTNEVIGKRIADIIKTEYISENDEKVLKNFIDKGFWSGEIIQERKNGEKISIFSSVTLIKDEHENPIGAVAINRDITEQKLDEERKKEELYLNLVEVIIVALDREGNITLLNKKGYDILEHEEGELIGKNWFENCLPPDDRERVFEYFKKLMTGEIDIIPFYENPIYTKNGNEKLIAWSAILIKDNDGNLTGLLSSGQDITERKKVELELIESENRYKYLAKELEMILDHIPGIVVYKDTENNILRVNKFMADAHNLKKEDMEGKSSFEFYPYEEAQAYWEDDLEVIESKKPKFNIIEPWETLKGRRWVNTSKIPYIDEESNVKGIIAIATDITESREAEEKLRESEERLKYLVSSSPTMIYSSRASGDFGATFISENVYEQTGYTPENFIIDLEFWLSKIHPKDKERVLFELSDLPEKEHLIYDYRFKFKDGTYHWMRDEVKLVKDENGNPIETIGSWIDITDRKMAEERIKESEEKYRHLFESSPNAIMLTSKEGIIIDCNMATIKMFGYNKDELIGKYYIDVGIFTPDQVSYFVKTFKKLRQGIETKPFELKIRKQDGSLMWVNYQSSMVILDGQILVESIVQDITEKKKAEDMIKEEIKKLKELDQIKSEFIDRASHELKTPLNSI